MVRLHFFVHTVLVTVLLSSPSSPRICPRGVTTTNSAGRSCVTDRLYLRLRGGADVNTRPFNVDPALGAMQQCTEAARSGEQDLVDGYALLRSLRDRGEFIGLEVYHEMLRVCIEAVREGKAATVDGEQILELIAGEGFVPTYETYELLMSVVLEGAKQDPQRGFLSEGYEVLERMEAAGLEPRNETYTIYSRIYDEQWPNVVEIDENRDGWCVLTEEEDRLWQGDPELGIPPDPSCDPKYRVHVDDIPDIPLTDADKAYYERWKDYDSDQPSSVPSSSSF